MLGSQSVFLVHCCYIFVVLKPATPHKASNVWFFQKGKICRMTSYTPLIISFSCFLGFFPCPDRTLDQEPCSETVGLLGQLAPFSTVFFSCFLFHPRYWKAQDENMTCSHVNLFVGLLSLSRRSFEICRSCSC